MKLRVFELEVNEFKNVPDDLRKLSNAVDNNFAKKTVYSQLATKFSNIDTKMPSNSGLAAATQCDLNKQRQKHT